MSLKSKSFLIYKGDTLDSISQYIDQEIGLNSYLIKGIQATVLSETVTQVTLLFNKYPDQILDTIAPREGAIFSSGVSSDDFDVRFLFNSPIDFGSVQSGTFSIDSLPLAKDKIYLDPYSNNYFIKISASGAGFQDNAFHTYQISRDLKRKDGSLFPYTPVGGYIFNELSSAHIGDYTKSYIERRRGKVSVGVLRLSKSINPQQGIVEYLSQRQISEDRLVSYTTVSASTNISDVYFIYINKLEPQIVSGFPLNNALLPDISAPNKVTLVFNVKLDKAKLLSEEGLFTIESGFTTSINVDPTDITLLDDLKTVEIDTTTYFTAQKVYSIIARPGILGLDGLTKEKPEQWTIHISAYEGGGNLIFTGEISGAPTGAEYIVNQPSEFLPNAIQLRFSNRITGIPPAGPGGAPGYITISGVLIDESFIFISGQVTGVSGRVTITESNIASNYAIFTGHTGITGVHFTQADISIGSTQIYDLSSVLNDFVTGLSGVENSVFTGHTGEINPHGTTYLEVGAVSLGEYTGHTGQKNPHGSTYIEVGAAGLAQFTGHTGNYNNPHNVTAAQIGAATVSQYNYLSGEVASNYTYLTGQITGNFNFLSASILFVNSRVDTLTGHTGDFNNPHNVTTTQIGAASTTQYNFLSGQHTGHTGRIDNPHSVTAAQVGAPTLANYSFLSGRFTGHTGLKNPHGLTLADLGGQAASKNLQEISDLSLTAGDLIYFDGSSLVTLNSITNDTYILGLQIDGGGNYIPYWKAPGGSLLGSVLNDLDDVEATPTTGSLLGYNTNLNEWQAFSVSGSGSVTASTNTGTKTIVVSSPKILYASDSPMAYYSSALSTGYVNLISGSLQGVGTGERIEVEFNGGFLNNSSSTLAIYFRTSLGTFTLENIPSTTYGSTSNRYGFQVKAILAVKNSGEVAAQIFTHNYGAAPYGSANTSASTWMTSTYNTGSANVTGNPILTFDFRTTVTGGTQGFDLYSYSVIKYPKTNFT